MGDAVEVFEQEVELGFEDEEKEGKVGQKVVKYEDLPDIITIHELAAYLRIGRDKAYTLAHTPGFPKKRFGRTFIFPKALVREWIENEARAEMDVRNTGGKVARLR